MGEVRGVVALAEDVEMEMADMPMFLARIQAMTTFQSDHIGCEEGPIAVAPAIRYVAEGASFTANNFFMGQMPAHEGLTVAQISLDAPEAIMPLWSVTLISECTEFPPPPD